MGHDTAPFVPARVVDDTIHDYHIDFAKYFPALGVHACALPPRAARP